MVRLRLRTSRLPHFLFLVLLLYLLLLSLLSLWVRFVVGLSRRCEIAVWIWLLPCQLLDQVCRLERPGLFLLGLVFSLHL